MKLCKVIKVNYIHGETMGTHRESEVTRTLTGKVNVK